MWRTLALVGVCLGGLIVLRFRLSLSDGLVAASVWARYSLGIVGAALTSWTLVSQGRVFANRGVASFGRDLAWAALENIMSKLNLHTRAELVRYAVDKSLIEMGGRSAE